MVILEANEGVHSQIYFYIKCVWGGSAVDHKHGQSHGGFEATLSCFNFFHNLTMVLVAHHGSTTKPNTL